MNDSESRVGLRANPRSPQVASTDQIRRADAGPREITVITRRR
jgi:hypothetical protein